LVIFESNKCVLSKYENFVDVGYESEGLFRLSLSEYCNNVVNNIMNFDKPNIWHSRFYHINFGYMAQLANLSLILKFTLVKGSRCHIYVELKQPHKVTEARDLAPLELIPKFTLVKGSRLNMSLVRSTTS
jgi:hypothetical protein